MNRIEALHTLGLDDDATLEDIKVAYRETVQILHPDRFAGNKKLAERATEQFKHLQEAYEYLIAMEGDGHAGRSRASGGSAKPSGAYSHDDEIAARIAGIDAARVQLVAQRDSALDQRRRGLGMVVVGAIVAFLLVRRIPWLGGIGGAAAVWGILDLVSSHAALKDLDAQLAKLALQKRQLLAQLDEE